MQQHLIPYPVTLLCASMLPMAFVVNSQGTCDINSCKALQRAKELGRVQPSRELKKGGEFEGLDFWEEHESLFAQAWSELPHLHPELYEYNDAFQDKFINPKLRTVVKSLKASSASDDEFVDESRVWKLITQSDVVRDVFYVGKTDETDFGLFTREFCLLLLEELEHLSNSGIPMRRPNGMNRYGAILGKYR